MADLMSRLVLAHGWLGRRRETSRAKRYQQARLDAAERLHFIKLRPTTADLNRPRVYPTTPPATTTTGELS